MNPANPNSKKGNKGLNENYGREVMELHTVGVNGGYTQTDVTTLSAILTGWTVDRLNQGGGFVFDPKRHEPGPKTWFGYVIDDNGNVTPAGSTVKAAVTWGPGVAGANKEVVTNDAMKQGIAALNILASSPKTAQFICSLLAQHFVSDTPPQALVDRLAKVYLASNGDIKTILRALIASHSVEWVPPSTAITATPVELPRGTSPPQRGNPKVEIVPADDAIESWRRSLRRMTELCGGDHAKGKDLLVGDPRGSELFLRATRIFCDAAEKRNGTGNAPPPASL